MVDAAAETRASPEEGLAPVTVHLKVVLDEAGRPLRIETLDLTGAEDAELDRLPEDL